jgi:glycerophosphoryl diester phosphodiesterase
VFDLRRAHRPGRPLLVGHRGAMGHAPENTFASFEIAHAMGVDMVECDVHLSADGVPVVIHDETLDRTTDGRGLVGDRVLADLRVLDAGAWRGADFRGQRLPTLDELIRWCRARLPLSIEIKNGPVFYPGIAERVVELVRRHEMIDRTIVISFDHLTARRVKELEPSIATGILYHGRLADGPGAAQAALADALMPSYAFGTADVCQHAHAAGLAVSVWTIDDPAVARALAANGVDAIATNYPDRIKPALD